MTPASDTPASQAFVAAGGEAGALMRSIDWSATSLGPVDQWPQSLRTTLDILLTSPFPMFLWWGPERIQFYNDGYRPSLGANKHPRAMGQRGEECWPEIWPIIGPMIDGVMDRGQPVYAQDQLIPVDRNGFMEEVFWTFSYSPVRAEDGGVGGTLVIVNETTQRVQAERRLRTLRDLAIATSDATTAEQTCARATHVLAQNPADIPFALVYLVERDGCALRLAGATGIERGGTASPEWIALESDGPGSGWPVTAVLQTLDITSVDALPAEFGPLPGGPWPESARAAVVVPIGGPSQPGQMPAGVLIAGCSPRVPRTPAYEEFYLLVGNQLANAFAQARAYDAERRRAESLAELDRAKTAFFSNVSHEFRTPLTLLLGPSEDLLADLDDPLTPGQRVRQELIQRNAQRLLKLVNTLLEFSRIEAGRMRAAFQSIDLPAYTAELVATFRSAIERAGLQLLVETPPLPDGVDVFVDPEMWERVVLNLVSNALKFTFVGTIEVSTRVTDGRFELIVRDTGGGIPEHELPGLFERFQRIEGAAARTQEGSGIGLALVHELVKAHGGSIVVDSAVGRGSTFTVALPTGSAHLPAEAIVAPRALAPGAGARPFVDEALRWLPESDDLDEPIVHDAWIPASLDGHAERERARILWVDDNADMRAYVARLLGERYEVHAVGDGHAALAAATERPPDLVLSDVMLPGLDGFALLHALRAAPTTADVPVILLSARAGEEAKVAGLEAGADDYLVKPFSARELLARVEAHLSLARLRGEALVAAQGAVRAREEFLSIASHELRTPVATIRGSAQLLGRLARRDQLTMARVLEFAATIESATGKLGRLLDDLLDVTRLTTGQLRVRQESIDFARLVERTVHQAQQTAPAHQLLLTRGDGVTTAWVDPDRIEQVLTNLLENAIKYSPDGGPISVSVASDQAGTSVRIQDAGIGLPPGTEEAIFQPFGRAANALEQRLPGMGLGLYICRQIVEAHHGRLSAESAGVGLGTVFVLWLPVRASNA